ncbi:hypothetical protein E1871_01045 [Salmonella enterica subsp. enterica serovar Mgulani]|nr:hypothetical protein [Salmonella enterica subsp. enterica]EAA7500458.1 hypothetical protein [Salmonella enterica subsp. enterica serovar Thompson]EAB3813993.1 hypothetical protein [Salmonella enterica]EBS3057645.1 hypothetical protein [Salmonella enterica subsp. enterica serovar Litchfield]EBW6099641.1 hypothetical protein [Salmonella enterica subsp. enterica serovar Augustenborg]EBY1533410.1 hypothetical protein [Salmonella enterica subsp. enterica serovar Mgulani]
MSVYSFAFSDWRCRRAKPTIKIPEVLIGEIIRYALRTCLLHQPARMRRFFFAIAPVTQLV